MNQLTFGNIKIPIPNVINFINASVDSSKLTISTDENIYFIKNWMQALSNPISFNMDDYTCDIKLEINDKAYYFRKTWPCSVLDLGKFCVIEFIFNNYSIDNIYEPYVVKPYIKESNKKELEKIELNKILNELDNWLKNPQDDWEKRFNGGVR